MIHRWQCPPISPPGPIFHVSCVCVIPAAIETVVLVRLTTLFAVHPLGPLHLSSPRVRFRIGVEIPKFSPDTSGWWPVSSRKAINLCAEWCQFKVAINTPLFSAFMVTFHPHLSPSFQAAYIFLVFPEQSLGRIPDLIS